MSALCSLPRCVATLLVLIFFTVFIPSYARLKGQAKTDSLLLELKKAKSDTNQVALLGAIANSYRGTNYHEAVRYGKQGVALAEKLSMRRGIVHINYALGNIYADHADWGNSMKCYNRALEAGGPDGDKEMTASLLNNIAATYKDLSDYPNALETNLKALKLFEEINNENGQANCHINIGGILGAQGDNEHAIEHFQKALTFYKKTGFKEGIALALNNLGDTYTYKPDYAGALKSFEDAYQIYKEQLNVNGEDMTLCNIAGIHIALANYAVALENGLHALAISRTHELAEGMGYDYRVISEAWYGMATNDTARKHSGMHTSDKKRALQLAGRYADSAITTFTSIGALAELASVTELASKIAAESGRYKEAYHNYELFKKLNDSVFNLEKNKKITQTAMQYEFGRREAATKAEQDKKDSLQTNIRNSIAAGLLGTLAFSVIVYRQRNRVKKEKENVEREKTRSEELLLNILPGEVAEELKAKGSSAARYMDDVTVMFTDFKDFTALSEKLSPEELVSEIHTCFSAFDTIMQQHGVEKIKTVGDAYMAAGGLPTPNTTHPTDVVAAALQIQQFMQDLQQQRIAKGRPYFEVRIGIHTGPVVAGIVGIKKFQYDIWGDTVNTASRMESSGMVGKVNISETTYELVKDKFTCMYRGEVAAKGKGMMKMYFVS